MFPVTILNVARNHTTSRRGPVQPFRKRARSPFFLSLFPDALEKTTSFLDQPSAQKHIFLFVVLISLFFVSRRFRLLTACKQF